MNVFKLFNLAFLVHLQCQLGSTNSSCNLSQDLARKHFGAQAFWRANILARKHFGAQTFWRNFYYV